MKEKLVLIICKLSDGQPLSRGESRLWNRHRDQFNPVFREKFDKDLYQEVRAAQDRAGEAWLRFKEQRLDQRTSWPQGAVITLPGNNAGKQVSHEKLLMLLKPAAAVAAIIAACWWYWPAPQQQALPIVENKKEAAPMVQPEWIKASLTLNDKSTINLDCRQNSIVAHEGAATVKAGNTGIAYLPDEDSTKPVCQHELKIPRAGQYQVQLSDGSSVILNAESVLRYPTRFTGSAREVELLHGEAYFTVAKNSKPFIIRSNKIAIRVTGTQFNCSAYENDDNITTTLVEGKVTIIKNDFPYDLAPGQQARYDKKHRNVEIEKVNLEDAVAWKNGYFSFNNTALPGIAKTIERWYNVKVIVHAGVQEKTYTNKRIQKNTRLEKLLDAITGSLNISYKSENGTVHLYE
ncbi:MAG: FecR domain-containing protein [Niastella sp.]|nr:FecR domain-containing protein [Niastella sp.]